MISSNPPEGNNVKANTLVTLYVSTGTAPVNVPNVVGQQETAAESALQNAGFKPLVKTDPTSSAPTRPGDRPESKRRHGRAGLHGDHHRFRRRRHGALGRRRFPGDRHPGS